ncbi:MAG: hypothetical protein A2365_03695 [Candidatus Nealsonbacteria bacterium RIFOXYB1_FULL_40_15]|uniref:Uncharacterized protein n=2 Tax=Candidatus Nealsoniibacteriota TaxID=1817911 RepID=A0A1G2ERA4_9BACT|nr:MAG: hypothetical protein A2365_03695 [Candidatus Nealsonbacteria bacterium RIFOXYB1_FULL_40_15]OGZ28336.1 MAG: hypothetical protein A2427_00300 [Candidatus Nealsonbacteria bacterium RIFOXYC1_FULL_40_7]OGZ29529.1 MAG: hypothetical protein A2562_02465 [Candidatus Nealsonbacteria bacterium RIFOXYD1_FULL_39_11]
MRRIFSIILILSVFLFIFSFFKKNDLPDKNEILNEIYIAPIQSETILEPFCEEKEGYGYDITPRYEYELRGVVVSMYDSENWLDYAHKADPLNTKDLCVLWGDNIKNEVYQQMKFKHGEFTCYPIFKNGIDRNWYQKFSWSYGSNNHLLPATDEVYKDIKKTQIGDQIYLKGYLVNYQIGAGTRTTSTIREDTGDRSCEVVYVTEFKVLKEGNALYRRMFTASGTIIVLILALKIIFFFTSAIKLAKH